MLNIKSLALALNFVDILVKEISNLSLLQDVALARNCAFDVIEALMDKSQGCSTQACLSFGVVSSTSISLLSCGPFD